MTQHEREKICRVIGMLAAMEYTNDRGIAEAASDARDILEEILQSHEEPVRGEEK